MRPLSDQRLTMFLRATHAAPPTLAAGGNPPRRHTLQSRAPLGAPPPSASAAASLPPPRTANGSDAAPRRSPLCPGHAEKAQAGR